MGNLCNPPERKRKVKFSPSLVEMMSFNSKDADKNVAISIHSNSGGNNINANKCSTASSSAFNSPERAIEQLVEQLYTTDNRENYLNARLLIQEVFFLAETVLAFEQVPLSSSSSSSAVLPASSISVVNKDKSANDKKLSPTVNNNNNNTNNTESKKLTIESFSHQFKKVHKLSYAKFCQILLEKHLQLPTIASDVKTDQKNPQQQQQQQQPPPPHQLDSENTLALYRALLYAENFDICLSTAFHRRKKAPKKIRRAALLSYVSVPSLGDKLFVCGASSCSKVSAYFCLAYYPFAAKVLEFTMLEIACLRLLYRSDQQPDQHQQLLVVNRRFWFELFNLLYESADQFAEYWKSATAASTLSLAHPPPLSSSSNSAAAGVAEKPTKQPKHFISFSISAADRSLRSDVRLQALLGLEIRFLLESYSSASEALAEKITTQVINFATVVLALPPKAQGPIGIAGGACRDLVWDELIDNYYEACKGRRPFFYRRRSSK